MTCVIWFVERLMEDVVFFATAHSARERVEENEALTGLFSHSLVVLQSLNLFAWHFSDELCLTATHQISSKTSSPIALLAYFLLLKYISPQSNVPIGRPIGSGCAQNHGFFSCRTFNPADYAEPTQTEESYGRGSTWNNTGNLEPEEGASKEPSYCSAPVQNHPNLGLDTYCRSTRWCFSKWVLAKWWKVHLAYLEPEEGAIKKPSYCLIKNTQ